MKDFNGDIIALAALRYAMGKSTYITFVIAQGIMDRLPEYADNTKLLMAKDISRALKGGITGIDIDTNAWEPLLNKIIEEIGWHDLS